MQKVGVMRTCKLCGKRRRKWTTITIFDMTLRMCRHCYLVAVTEHRNP